MDLQKQTLNQFLMSNYGVIYDTEYLDEIEDDWSIYSGQASWTKVMFDNGVKAVPRERYTLNMGKKVCEDWASLLLNEKTKIDVQDEQEQELLFGNEDLNGGLLGKEFWDLQNQLVERTFATGTGACLIRYTKINENGVPTKDSDIELHYIDARHIVPISQFNGDIKECAFVSSNGNEVVVEAHTIIKEDGPNKGKYLIQNTFFKKSKDNFLVEIEKDDYPKEFISEIKLFHTMKPNLYNPILDNGLGLSIISYAKDAIKSVDIAYDNFCSDIELGKKMVFMKKDLLRVKENGDVDTPQSENAQLFMYVGDALPSENPMVHEFNPSLRVNENALAVQSMLDYLSFRVGLGTKHYQFNASKNVTATQYNGDKQEMVQNANRHYIVIEKYLVGLIKALASAYSILGQGKPIENVIVTFADGFIIDEQEELESMRNDVIAQIVKPIYYIMKKYGVDEEEAQNMLYQEQEPEQGDLI